MPAFCMCDIIRKTAVRGKCMKKLFYILIIVLMVVLGGCGQAVDQTAPAGADEADVKKSAESWRGLLSQSSFDEFSETAQIHIEMQGLPGEEYAEAEFTADAGQVLEAESVKIKLRGNSSKESAKKAYTIKFEEEVELLGMDPGKKWALVSNPFDKSLMRPALGFAYAEALGLNYVPETRLCQVWVNEVFMGVYTVMEPVEAGEGRVEIDPEDGDFLLERNYGRTEEDTVYMNSYGGMRFEFNEPEEPDEAQQKECYDYLMKAEEAIFSGNHEEYEKCIDVESFVKFYVFYEMIKDVDFGEYSTRYYIKDGILCAGPPWDLDLTMGNVSAEKGEFKYDYYNNKDGSGDSSEGLWVASADYYYWLCQDPWFGTQVKQFWQESRHITENLAETNELGASLIDVFLNVHGDALNSNFEADENSGREVYACWTVDIPSHVSEWQQPAETYAGNVDLLRQWIIKRADYLDKEFGSY